MAELELRLETKKQAAIMSRANRFYYKPGNCDRLLCASTVAKMFEVTAERIIVKVQSRRFQGAKPIRFKLSPNETYGMGWWVPRAKPKGFLRGLTGPGCAWLRRQFTIREGEPVTLYVAIAKAEVT